MPNRPKWLLFAAAAVLFGLMPGCSRDSQTSPAGLDEFFLLTLGGHQVEVQLAITSAEKERGLMQRKSLGENEGMLFIYNQPRTMSFWMRNTHIPLDIGYFSDEGILLEIHPLFPHDEKLVGSHSDAVQYALEMNQGWFSTNGIRPGAGIDMEGLSAAIEARGFSPRRFGIP